MATPQTFVADIERFALNTEAKLDALVRESSQEVISSAQTPQPSVKLTGGIFETGKVPVDTAHLRNSLVVDIPGRGTAEGGDTYVLLVGEAEAGDVIRAWWTAEYARTIEAGDGRIRPRFFVRTHTERWTDIVYSIAARLMGA